jgi:zinc protease
VPEAELQKAKNQTMMDYMDGLTTIDGKAQALAINEIIFGDYRHLFSDLERYNKVKVQDIRNVAKKYLQSQRRVVGVLEPKTK